MIKLRGLNHAAFRVSDVEKATAFYEKVIGLKRIPRPDFGFGGPSRHSPRRVWLVLVR